MFLKLSFLSLISQMVKVTGRINIKDVRSTLDVLIENSLITSSGNEITEINQIVEGIVNENPHIQSYIQNLKNIV